MNLNLDQACQAARDLAKRAVAEGEKLGIPCLMAAVYYATDLQRSYPVLKPYLKEPVALRKETPDKVDVARELQTVFEELARSGHLITPERLMLALIQAEPGRGWLIDQGMPESEVKALERALEIAASDWRGSAQREEAIRALSSFGRMLTAMPLPEKGIVEVEKPLRALLVRLSQMKGRSAVITGPSGAGKSALVYELARRLAHGDESIPEHLRDYDIFELSPVFLRAGAHLVGEYEERIKALIKVLQAYPKIILFVDEIHTLVRSGMHASTPFSQAEEALKAALTGDPEIVCIGCTTRAEYRHYIQPDEALARRFSEIVVEPPSPELTLRILGARLFRYRQHYKGLKIPEEILPKVVELTEKYLPSRYQPEKSIRLLDRACAYCVTENPPITEVTEEALWHALENTAGHPITRSARFTEDDVREYLLRHIVGQDEVLAGVARAFVAGLGGWMQDKGPRGVFFFCGPTGVGKTETALLLARILGGGREALVRVDCNALHGSPNDPGPMKNQLLGAPPGYVGYVRGQGGILSRVRDFPECIILFDEIEKAPVGLANFLLQILDEGKLEDSEGHTLDFRRSFLIFTSNAGCDVRGPIGYLGPKPPRSQDVVAALKGALVRHGYDDAFLARIPHYFAFRALDQQAVCEVVRRQLRRLQETARRRGYGMRWDERLPAHLASQWQPRFGIRHLTAILINRVSEQLSVAEAQGELEDVQQIRLRPMPAEVIPQGCDLAGMARRLREKESLIVELA